MKWFIRSLPAFLSTKFPNTKCLNDSLENIVLLVPMNRSGNHWAFLLTEKRVKITYLCVLQQYCNPENGWNVRHHLSTAVHLVLLTVFSTKMIFLLIRDSVVATHCSGQLYRLSSKKYRHRKHSCHGNFKVLTQEAFENIISATKHVDWTWTHSGGLHVTFMLSYFKMWSIALF
jgi:hypothetical protein